MSSREEKKKNANLLGFAAFARLEFYAIRNSRSR
jgi:hypothetical protein